MTAHTEREDFDHKKVRKADRSRKYAAERYDPTLPYCGEGIILSFNGKRLTLFGLMDDFTPIWIDYNAVSGVINKNKKFDYSVENQKKEDWGPIPEGKYWIRPDEFWKNAWYKIRDPGSSWGNFRITIHPFQNTQTYNRGGFFIHGGSTSGSKGCIDLTGEIDKFYEDVKKVMRKNSFCQIQLFVQYK